MRGARKWLPLKRPALLPPTEISPTCEACAERKLTQVFKLPCPSYSQRGRG